MPISQILKCDPEAAFFARFVQAIAKESLAVEEAFLLGVKKLDGTSRSGLVHKYPDLKIVAMPSDHQGVVYKIDLFSIDKMAYEFVFGVGDSSGQIVPISLASFDKSFGVKNTNE